MSNSKALGNVFKLHDVINVKDPAYGAKGDGSTDDSAAFSSAITAASTGSVLVIPIGTYSLVGNWTINKSITVIAHGATLSFATDAANQGVQITASNVHWYGGTISGPQHTTSSNTQIGIMAFGTLSSYLSGLKIVDVAISNFGYEGIDMEFCEGFELSGNECFNNYYAGILVRSCKKGKINSNYIHDIVADSVVSTNGYGIAITKSTGTEATYPVSTDIEVHDNLIVNVPTWEGLDTHGGQRISFCNNTVIDCVYGIAVGQYNATGGSEKAPNDCIVVGNTVVNTGTISVNDVQRGIIVTGDTGSNTKSSGNVITGNTINGYGDQNASIETAGSGALEIQYTDGSVVAGNVIRNSGRHGILCFGATNFNINGNVIDTVTGTAAVAATGTITFGANPADGDTITINGRVFTFRDAPAGNYEIQRDGSTLATSLSNAVTQLNGNGSKDGRVYLATYSANSTVLTITFDTIGKSGNSFTLAASVATVSGANLTGGAGGSAGMAFRNLSGGKACTGTVRENVLSVGAYSGMQMATDSNTSVDFINNRHTGTGPLYDMRGSGSSNQAGSGAIIGFPPVYVTYDVPSINAAASDTVYIPMPGCDGAASWGSFVAANRVLAGLVMSSTPNNNYVTIEFDNPSAGAVNLGSMQIFAKAEKSITMSIDLGP